MRGGSENRSMDLNLFSPTAMFYYNTHRTTNVKEHYTYAYPQMRFTDNIINPQIILKKNQYSALII